MTFFAVDASVDDLFAYSAELVRVVDGDTLWMKISLTESIWIKQKLRLRGIDAPELGTPEGESAKRFMESSLRGGGLKKASAKLPADPSSGGEAISAPQITITTTKPDKWDRYLADVFLTTRISKFSRKVSETSVSDANETGDGEIIYLNNHMLENGHAFRYDRVRPEDWEGE